MAVIGIVAEGTHDFIMLDPFIRAELAKKVGQGITIKALQPAPDATGKMTDGGWGKVMGWCQKYAGAKLETFFKPLFSGDVPCDAIIVHLDGDALEVMAPHTAVVIPSGQLNPDARVKLVVAALEGILSPAARRNKVAFAVPVLHTEAWVLAAENSHPSPASIDKK